MDTRTHPTRLRLAALREAMRAAGHDAVLLPSADPHLSEYLPGHWQGREWFSGFTGSMGTLIVGATEAALFADSRYWTQAEAELAGSGVALVKVATAASQQHLEWITSHLTRGQTLAVDGQVLGLAAAEQLQGICKDAGIRFVTEADPLAAAWPERPALPAAAVYAHTAPHASLGRAEKLAQVRAAMAGHGASHHFISTVDDIAWLTNLRGADVDYNPVFLAHALLSADTATLYVGAGKIAPDLAAQLRADGWAVADYAQAAPDLAALPAQAVLLLDPRRVTWGLRRAAPEAVRVVQAINPSTLLKSRKSAADAEHIRTAMAEDGAAMCAFYARFEAAQAAGERLTEITVDEWLSAERARRPGFVGLSFPTIAGFNANGAMPHYRALPDAHAVIEGDGLLLIDSGAQYLGGTTDITRVWPIGTPSAEQRRDYTRVLKGTIALSRTRFPLGTLSPMLDALARAPLWADSADYGHGTGHGVGYFLNVHEGPQSISKAMPDANMAMQPGMVTSIEPGLYKPGRWGVRIENLVLNVPAPESEFGEFLQFETLTLCPIDTRCIDRGLLDASETAWLNTYHQHVRERLLPLVSGAAREWLLARTEAL